MSAFDLQKSLRRAAMRLGSPQDGRRRRSDRGRSRLDPALLAELDTLLQGQERPAMSAIASSLRARGLRVPARATIYQRMATLVPTSRRATSLPTAVRDTLYNLADDAEVPGHQLAFHCLNYGELDAITYAAGLPWLALYQAARLRGWRPRSRALLDAILRARGI